MIDKSKLRQALRNKRQQLSLGERHAKSYAAAQCFLQTPQYVNAEHIACFISQDGEIDTQLLIETIILHKKKCYLPIMHGEHLLFAEYRFNTPMTKNRFRIPEPIATPENHIDADKLDIVLMPAVGFDPFGRRLGMGGGHYDRTFAFLNISPRPPKPLLIGLGFSCQRVEQLPADSWDVKMDGIVTEYGFCQTII